jgi:hypothetical protein
MGGMGRQFDGGYTEYTCVPATQVQLIETKLDWATLDAIPEINSHGGRYSKRAFSSSCGD